MAKWAGWRKIFSLHELKHLNVEVTHSRAEIHLALLSQFSLFPVFTYVYYNFGLILKKASCSLEIITWNLKLAWSSKEYLQIFKSLFIYKSLLRFLELFQFVLILVKNRCSILIGIINSCDSVSPSTFENSFSFAQEHLTLFESVVFV